MALEVGTKVISDARTAWKMLSGIICVYKPPLWGTQKLFKELKRKICDDLNGFSPPPRQERIEIRRVNPNSLEKTIPLENEEVLYTQQDDNKHIQVVKGLDYADHPLVVGKRYIYDDINLVLCSKVGKHTSGVCLLGINKGGDAQKIRHGRWLHTYLVSGRFGIATNTFFHTGNVFEKSTYGSINIALLERLLALIQSSQQRLSFSVAGASADPELAYNLASQGLIRPAETTAPLIYAMKCVDFSLPEFTLEIKAINCDEKYLMEHIHMIGLKLRSVASCTKIQCTNIGPFSLQHSLLFKHWTASNVVDNIKNCRTVLREFDINQRNLWVDKPLKLPVEDEDNT